MERRLSSLKHQSKEIFSLEINKTTAWNEFSSTVSSAIICLATNQKFNFSKWIFDIMGRNLDNISGKFFMYPRFIQVFLDKLLEGLSKHERKYVAPSHTKKIFRNIRGVGKDFSGNITPLFPTMVVQSQLGEGSTIPADPQHTPIILQPSTSQPQKTQKHRKPRRKDTQVPQLSVPTESVADEAVYKELDDSLVGAATTASSLEAEQDSGNINKTQSKATPNKSSSHRTDSGGGPMCQEAMRVLDLKQTKITQANEIDSLKRRVNKLKKKQRSRTYKLKRLYKVGLTARIDSSDNEQSLGEDASKQGRISDIDADEGITLVSTHDDAEMFDTDKDLHVSTAVTTATILINKVTLAQALAKLKRTKPKAKAKGVVFHKPEESTTTTTTTIPKPKSQDKELQAEFDKEQRLAREKAQQEEEANIALIEI
nr:hypothetical protein [Tanacetum cinerariifolium]